jgi:hypothetical protein
VPVVLPGSVVLPLLVDAGSDVSVVPPDSVPLVDEPWCLWVLELASVPVSIEVPVAVDVDWVAEPPVEEPPPDAVDVVIAANASSPPSKGVVSSPDSAPEQLTIAAAPAATPMNHPATQSLRTRMRPSKQVTSSLTIQDQRRWNQCQ